MQVATFNTFNAVPINSKKMWHILLIIAAIGALIALYVWLTSEPKEDEIGNYDEEVNDTLMNFSNKRN